MKKQIGLPCWSLGDGLGISLAYLEYFSKFGTIIPLLPNKDVIPNLDLVVLPGGPDVSSFLYDQAPGFRNSNADRYREYFFMNNLPKYIADGVPIFGVCLGLQQINVHFGGTLVQDWSFPYSSKERGERVEQISIDKDLFESRFLYRGAVVGDNIPKTMKVNSLHHQGVFTHNLSNELDILAISDICKNIEMLCHKTLPIAAVQYHPEELDNDVLVKNIIRTLINSK